MNKRELTIKQLRQIRAGVVAANRTIWAINAFIYDPTPRHEDGVIRAMKAAPVTPHLTNRAYIHRMDYASAAALRGMGALDQNSLIAQHVEQAIVRKGFH